MKEAEPTKKDISNDATGSKKAVKHARKMGGRGGRGMEFTTCQICPDHSTPFIHLHQPPNPPIDQHPPHLAQQIFPMERTHHLHRLGGWEVSVSVIHASTSITGILRCGEPNEVHEDAPR